MALTAYSIERAGTTYSTARSQRDCFTTLHCGEVAPLDLAVVHRRRATLKAFYRRISLTASVSPPRKYTQRRPLGGCTGAIHHSYQTTRRLTQQASAPMVVPYALVPRYARHKCGSRELLFQRLQQAVTSQKAISKAYNHPKSIRQ